MPQSLTELARKAAARKIKAAQDAEAEALRERKAGMAERKALARIKIKQRDLLGETIRDADLTPQEHVVIANILSRRKDIPNDWDVLANWLPPARPAPVAKPDELEAAE
jgi:hypothetical protein